MNSNTVERVKEIIGSYSRQTRSVSDDFMQTCSYLKDDGNRCALGKMLTPEALKVWHEVENGGEDGFSVTYSYSRVHLKMPDNNIPSADNEEILDNWLDTQLQEDFRGLGVNIIKHIQELHDYIQNWVESGLSVMGKTELEHIINKIEWKQKHEQH